jgi:uncharacterized protein (TIGR02246 family)
MRSHCKIIYGLGFAVLIGFAAPRTAAGQEAARAEDEQAIRAAAKQYLAALERGDAKRLAELWTSDGDFVDELGGSHPASELIAEAAQSTGNREPPQVKLLDSRIRFLTGDVALEDGTSDVSRVGAKSPARGRFSALWVKQQGRWRLASLREARIQPAASPAVLADLAWMIGQWSAQTNDTTLEISARWNATETFLLRDLKVLRAGQVAFQAAQRIGWDPISHKIRSWIFDSDGGYGEASWSRDGESWVIQASGVLPDGRQTSATSVVTYDGKDRLSWKTMAATIDGQPGPNLDVEFTRKPPAR